MTQVILRSSTGTVGPKNSLLTPCTLVSCFSDANLKHASLNIVWREDPPRPKQIPIVMCTVCIALKTMR